MMSGKMGDGTGARPNRAGSGGNASSSFMAPGDFSAPPPPAVGGGSGAPGMMTGKMGQPTGSGGAAPSSSTRPMSASSFDGTYDFSGEPPLLEELGVDMRRIWYKTLAVVNPLKRIDVSIMKAQDSDLAGPLIFACTLGALLMFQGKLQFGYVFGLMVFGSLALSMLFNLMAQESQVRHCCLLVFVFFLSGLIFRPLSRDHISPSLPPPVANTLHTFTPPRHDRAARRSHSSAR